MAKTWCSGERHFSEPINQNAYEKLILKLKKLLKLKKVVVIFVDMLKAKILQSERLKEKIFIEKQLVNIDIVHQ